MLHNKIYTTTGRAKLKSGGGERERESEGEIVSFSTDIFLKLQSSAFLIPRLANLQSALHHFLGSEKLVFFFPSSFAFFNFNFPTIF
jgi:hypothetical protein